MKKLLNQIAFVLVLLTLSCMSCRQKEKAPSTVQTCFVVGWYFVETDSAKYFLTPEEYIRSRASLAELRARGPFPCPQYCNCTDVMLRWRGEPLEYTYKELEDILSDTTSNPLLFYPDGSPRKPKLR